MFDKMREDIRTICERDPAARSALEVMLLYNGYKAVSYTHLFIGCADAPHAQSCTVRCNGRHPSFLPAASGARITLPSPFNAPSAAAISPSAALFGLHKAPTILGHRFIFFLNIARSIRFVNSFFQIFSSGAVVCRTIRRGIMR